MTQLLDYVESILTPIIQGSEGTRKPTANRFRRSLDNASLRDPNYPLIGFDRAYEIEWESDEDNPDDPYNAIDGTTTSVLVFALNVGYVYGVAADGSVSTTGSEVAATVVKHARKRALSDAKMLQRALLYGPDVSGNLGGGVGMAPMGRVGATTIEDLGSGKLLSVTRYKILVSFNPATDYSP
jgi:hypothetical protein